MDDRKNRDFSKGPVWMLEKNRWQVEIRLPNGTRLRRRFKREREAKLFWAGEHARIEDGTWDQRAARNITVAKAMEEFRAYSRVQHRSHKSYVIPSLKLWEKFLGPTTQLGKVTSQQVEAFKLQRAQEVSKGTTDHALTVLKAFFNWCVAHNLAVANPVRRVKLFHEDNSRLRYLTVEEYERLVQ